MTIYKWWPSKGALALDGYFHRVEAHSAFPTRATSRPTCAPSARLPRRAARRPRRPVIAELIGQAQTDPDLKAAYLHSYSAPRRALAVAAWNTRQGARRTACGSDLETVVDQLWGACYHRLLVPDQPLDEQFVDALVDNLFRGIAPRG